MIVACRSCSKPIDEPAPDCPACGARQPDPAAAAARRRAWLAAAFVLGLAGGALGEVELRMAHIRELRGRRPPPRPGEAERRAKVRERVAQLKADAAFSYAELEDVLLEPRRYEGRRVSVMAYLFSVKTPGAERGRLSAGWGHGGMLNIDLSRLGLAQRTQAAGLIERPHFVVARGLAAVEGGEALLRVERLDVVEIDPGVETLPGLLAD